jgi:hypothetical protein
MSGSTTPSELKVPAVIRKNRALSAASASQAPGLSCRSCCANPPMTPPLDHGDFGLKQSKITKRDRF